MAARSLIIAVIWILPSCTDLKVCSRLHATVNRVVTITSTYLLDYTFSTVRRGPPAEHLPEIKRLAVTQESVLHYAEESVTSVMTLTCRRHDDELLWRGIAVIACQYNTSYIRRTSDLLAQRLRLFERPCTTGNHRQSRRHATSLVGSQVNTQWITIVIRPSLLYTTRGCQECRGLIFKKS